MTNIGLLPLAERVADALQEASKHKRGATETRRRLVSAIMPLLGEAVGIGMNQALIAIDERKRALSAREK